MGAGRFGSGDSNTSYITGLLPDLMDVAIWADFMDEPIWRAEDVVRAIDSIEALRFAVTNIYVYALRHGRPVVPSYAVYDLEIEEAPREREWDTIVSDSAKIARDYVQRLVFPGEDPLHGSAPAFSFWAFDEPTYRGFQDHADRR